MPERVMVNESGDCWINQSNQIAISVFGETDNHSMNASIEISGCGLSISIDEKYAVEEGYWIEEGMYNSCYQKNLKKLKENEINIL
jgi:hypothetical protein